jgi:ABC-type multidrug transport system ATPase subunit
MELIAFLGLSHVMDNIIGDPEDVGPRISGGQRKRVNVAIEAVSDPSILFLGKK